jgi:DNA-directed RNA polymerase specialized sigma24 family protein
LTTLADEEITRWVLGLDPGASDAGTGEFLSAAKAAWPRALAHTRRELGGGRSSATEVVSLAFELWEPALRSVWKTYQSQRDTARIENIEHYLVGVFRHRLNRYLSHKRQDDSVLDFRPPQELEILKVSGAVDDGMAARIGNSIQLERVYAAVGEDIRHAMVARTHGYSWADIAVVMGTEEQNLIMRVQYAIRKFRTRVSRRVGE